MVATPLMSTFAQSHNTLAGIDGDIADAERFLIEGLTAIRILLKKREDTAQAERRMGDIRFTLETLRALRRQHVRTASFPARQPTPKLAVRHAETT